MVNVMVVEDQIMERQLLEIIVEGSDAYAMAYSIDSAAMAEVYCATSKVDLVLMDVLTAFGESGLEAAARIKTLLNNHPTNANARFVDMTLSHKGMQVSRS